MELNSVSMTACLSSKPAWSVLNCLNTFRWKTAVPLKQIQRLLGHLASAAAVTLLGLMHMRPLQAEAPWHTPCDHHIELSNIQPMVGPCLSMGWSGPRTSVPGMLLSQQTPQPRAGMPYATGMLPRAPGQDLHCSGLLTATSC